MERMMRWMFATPGSPIHLLSDDSIASHICRLVNTAVCPRGERLCGIHTNCRKLSCLEAGNFPVFFFRFLAQLTGFCSTASHNFFCFLLVLPCALINFGRIWRQPHGEPSVVGWQDLALYWNDSKDSENWMKCSYFMVAYPSYEFI